MIEFLLWYGVVLCYVMCRARRGQGGHGHVNERNNDEVRCVTKQSISVLALALALQFILALALTLALMLFNLI